MTEHNEFQNKALNHLEDIFSEVEKEWNVSKESTDHLQGTEIYSPRSDLAIGPLNPDLEHSTTYIENTFKEECPTDFLDQITKDSGNCHRDPVCSVSIEVSFSGSSKHLLGDITNAGILGLYGVVVTNKEKKDKIKRIYQYAKKTDKFADTGNVYDNVTIMEKEDFLCKFQ